MSLFEDDPDAPAPGTRGHTAVMAQRAPGAEGELDYFPTPPWAARAGGELIQQLDPCPYQIWGPLEEELKDGEDSWSCWESACGEGHMVHGLGECFAPGRIFASDISDCRVGPYCDFLRDDLAEWGRFDWVVTNPPFKDGEAFVRRAWAVAARGVAMLLRLQFLEGVARHKLLHEDCPLSVCAPFAERVPMVKGRWDPDASSATAYAWFIFLKPGVAASNLPGPRIIGIPPGTRARLTRRSDFELFAPERLGTESGEIFGERSSG